MKKLLTILTLLYTWNLAALAQTGTIDQKVVHNHYTTYYNPVNKEPDSVVWDLTPSMMTCGQPHGIRKFKADPAIAGCPGKTAYNAGWSRGHLFNFEEALCSDTDIMECCYMSNMLPQDQHFNAGDWKTVEKYEQNLARAGGTLHILAGGTGTQGKNIGGVNIPQFMWKAIYTNGQWTYWIMPNRNTSVRHHWDYWKTDKATFDGQTGLAF